MPAFTSPHLHVVRTDTGWLYATRPNATAVVAVLAINEDREVLLVRQHRQPLGTDLLELPAGLVGDDGDPDEAALTAAKRELEEETGHTAKHWTELGRVASSPGLTDEVVTLFLAQGLTRTGDGGGIAGEDITVVRRPLADLPGEGDQPLDAKLLAALTLARRHL